jgi:hypothetical protein
MQTVEGILTQLGGYATVASAANIPATTVHSWQRSNFVPEWRRPALLALAKRKRVPLTDADFPARSQSTAA